METYWVKTLIHPFLRSCGTPVHAILQKQFYVLLESKTIGLRTSNQTFRIAILVQKLNESSLYVLTPGPRGMWIFPLSILRFNIVRTVGSLVQC